MEPVQFDALRLRGVCCSQFNVKNLSHSSTTLADTNRDASPPLTATHNSPMTPAPSNTFGNFRHFESHGDEPIVLEAAQEAGSASSDLEYDTSSSLPSPEVFRCVCDKGTPSVSTCMCQAKTNIYSHPFIYQHPLRPFLRRY